MPAPRAPGSSLVYAASAGALAVLILCALIGVSVWRLLANADRAAALREAQVSLATFGNALGEAEATHRSFLISGRGQPLTMHNEAVERLERARTAIAPLLGNDDAATSLLGEVNRTSQAMLTEWRRLLVVRETQGLDAVQQDASQIGARSAATLAALTPLRTHVETALAREAGDARDLRSGLLLRSVLAALGVTATIATLALLVLRERRARRQLEALLGRELQHDAQTSLPNSRFFSEWLGYALANARRDGDVLGLLMITVDADGVEIRASAMAPEIARRLRAIKRESDLLARVDEATFALAALRPNSRENLVRLGERIQHALREPPMPGATLARISPNVGIAMFPEDADDLPGLVAAAESALSAARHNRTSRIFIKRPALG